MAHASKQRRPEERKKLSPRLVTQVLTEAGYRCAVPTCRGILAIDMHHIWEVAVGGGDTPQNLIALCPTCHALYHRGTISQDSIYVYKSMLVALSHAFDVETVDRLLFLSMCPEDYLILSGDGLLHFSRIISAGLATVAMKANNAWQIVTYAVNISPQGKMLVEAWRAGDRTRLASAMQAPLPEAGTPELPPEKPE